MKDSPLAYSNIRTRREVGTGGAWLAADATRPVLCKDVRSSLQHGNAKVVEIDRQNLGTESYRDRHLPHRAN